MVFVHLKLKEMKENFWHWLSLNLFTYFKQEAYILKPNEHTWAVSEFKIHYEFWTHLVDFKLDHLFPTYEFKIDLNSPKFRTQPLVTDCRLWDMSKRVSNASIQFKTHHTHLELVIFGVFFKGYLWLFVIISGQSVPHVRSLKLL